VGEGETIEATIEPPAEAEATAPDEIAAEGPPLDLNEPAEEAPLSEDELLGEVIETGEPIDHTQHAPEANGQANHEHAPAPEHEQPAPPAEEEQGRRSLFRRSRRG
jgi:hypothetical protein